MAEEKGSKAAASEKKAAPATTGSEDTKLFGALCYIPILFISIVVPLYILLTEKKQDKFLAFHAWQSLLISVACFVVFGAMFAMTMVVTVLSGGLGALLYCIVLPLAFAVLLGLLFVAYKAYQGERYKVPVLGEFAEKQANK